MFYTVKQFSIVINNFVVNVNIFKTASTTKIQNGKKKFVLLKRQFRIYIQYVTVIIAR